MLSVVALAKWWVLWYKMTLLPGQLGLSGVYAQCHLCCAFMLSVIMLNVVMLNVVMLSGVEPAKW
jgi:hypothetical protein